ncbi:hypothetical protein [Ruegeria arenilitoris]|uniref:hypothetical protein n=1 Tax=Ruegeria arenilitoris TaxID=1173585 RepID=UPI00147BF09E|nr:hypothetical protein [Ruegeria arenilitoris]
MSAIEVPIRMHLWQRVLFAIPLFGWMAKDVAHGDPDDLGYTAAAIFAMWGCSAMIYGLPGLYLPALAMVPLMFLLLILVSRG